MKKLLFGIIVFFSLWTPATAALQTQSIYYSDGETVLKGFLAFDDSITAKRPGILVVHEWWGHNAYARKRAEMLAELGFTALAIDMYGKGKQAMHPEEAGQFSGEIKKNLPLARKRFEAALDILKTESTVDTEKIAAIGYCFGGGVVLEMAREGLDLDGVVSFHGSLTTDNPAQAGKIKARILVLNGQDDPFVKTEEIAAFKEEMEKAGVNYHVENYPGAVHSFTNPDADKFGKEFGLPLAYNKKADEQSWQTMQDFFKEIFK